MIVVLLAAGPLLVTVTKPRCVSTECAPPTFSNTTDITAHGEQLPLARDFQTVSLKLHCGIIYLASAAIVWFHGRRRNPTGWPHTQQCSTSDLGSAVHPTLAAKGVAGHCHAVLVDKTADQDSHLLPSVRCSVAFHRGVLNCHLQQTM